MQDIRNRKQSISVLSALTLLVPTLSFGQTSTASSFAEVWFSQTKVQKSAYLDGLCAGLHGGGHPAGELKCSPSNAPSAQGSGWQFCAIRYGFRPDGKGVSPTGGEILDAYYAKPANSNVSITQAIVHYNDQACHANRQQRTK